jgi:hypothetical protein
MVREQLAAFSHVLGLNRPRHCCRCLWRDVICTLGFLKLSRWPGIVGTGSCLLLILVNGVIWESKSVRVANLRRPELQQRVEFRQRSIKRVTDLRSSASVSWMIRWSWARRTRMTRENDDFEEVLGRQSLDFCRSSCAGLKNPGRPGLFSGRR